MDGHRPGYADRMQRAQSLFIAALLVGAVGCAKKVTPEACEAAATHKAKLLSGDGQVDEALAMAGKHRNVFLGTAAFPPHHWNAELLRFIAGAGRGKVMLGTSFPVVGHRHALTRLAELDLGEEARAALLEGTARRVFGRLAADSKQETKP